MHSFYYFALMFVVGLGWVFCMFAKCGNYSVSKTVPEEMCVFLFLTVKQAFLSLSVLGFILIFGMVDRSS